MDRNDHITARHRWSIFVEEQDYIAPFRDPDTRSVGDSSHQTVSKFLHTGRLVGTDPYQDRLADLAEASVPTEDVASACGLWPLSRLIKVFDEQHFVSRFVVYKFVDCAGGK